MDFDHPVIIALDTILAEFKMGSATVTYHGYCWNASPTHIILLVEMAFRKVKFLVLLKSQ